MLRSDPAFRGHARPGSRQFVLYVEGPSDRDILRLWVRRVSPSLARSLESCVVILGGRQPARAVEHFQQQAAVVDDLRAICVLDRDEQASPDSDTSEPGLEFFTWGRRHIESYLLVHDAIRRSLRSGREDPRIARLVREHVPSAEEALQTIDAKRLLAPRGELARALGRRVTPAEIARRMVEAELHPDVCHLIGRLQEGLGLHSSAPRVVIRSPMS